MLNMGAATYEAYELSNALGTCPACPQPNVNLPEDWSEHEYRQAFQNGALQAPMLTFYRDFLYATFLSGDGNFHLQLFANKSDLFKDPSVFGDHGAWTPYLVSKKYIKAAGNPRGFENASDSLITLPQALIFYLGGRLWNPSGNSFP
jgi:hypothetical protein